MKYSNNVAIQTLQERTTIISEGHEHEFSEYTLGNSSDITNIQSLLHHHNVDWLVSNVVLYKIVH